MLTCRLIVEYQIKRKERLAKEMPSKIEGQAGSTSAGTSGTAKNDAKSISDHQANVSTNSKTKKTQ